jgi:anti-anti-sigma factor
MLNLYAKKLGAVAVLTLQGQIVTAESHTLRSAVESLSEVSAIKLDLARVTTVDAGGLGVMLALREQLESKGIRFELMNVGRLVSKVLELAHLNSVFRITAGVDFFPAVSHTRHMSGSRLVSCA